MPTLLEVTGIPAPVMVDGIAQKPIEGVSMAYTFDKANADALTRHTTQYFETIKQIEPNLAIRSSATVDLRTLRKPVLE